MANTGFIFVSNASKIQNMCLQASSLVKKVLYVKFYDSTKYVTPLSLLSREIIKTYSKAKKDYNGLDIRLLLDTGKKEKIFTSIPIDIVLCDHDLIADGRNLSRKIINLNEDFQETTLSVSAKVPPVTCADEVKIYERVVVGGVFDRLHNGHKVLLSQAALRTMQNLTVAINDEIVLQNKPLWELIEPLKKREEVVTNFLKDIKPDLKYNMAIVQDTFGPTIYDSSLQMIVCSTETAWGAEKVNQYRHEGGMQLLKTYVVDIIKDTSLEKAPEEETKLSSFNDRLRTLGTIINPPIPKTHLPKNPYVVGLTGGVSSGKNTLVGMLKNKGVAVLDCGVIADKMLEPGLPLYITVSNIFGQAIFSKKQPEVVDRNVIIQIIQNDMVKLKEMRKLVFPVILKEIQNHIKYLGSEGNNLVVITASEMLQANWYEQCHQLWSVIAPPNVAVARARKCYNISQEQAETLVEQQPSNKEYIAAANVVFSSQWSFEFLQAQLDKAWKELQTRLKEIDLSKSE